ncbi:MAG TPA: magnesium transporter CorA family protein [Acidimicrobiales bacterium]|nr:magnesium transporter CorA family protein [Acidimicrobiales bacterium]
MAATITREGKTSPATADEIADALASGDFIWVDIDPDDGAELEQLLVPFHFHPLAVEDAVEFGQRPKVDLYDDFVYMVAHGAPAKGATGTAEVHLLFDGRFLVTVHRGACGALQQVTGRWRRVKEAEDRGAAPQVLLTYLIVDSLTDSFFPVLSDFDDRVDELEDAILQQPTEDQLGELFTMKRSLLAIRKVVTPQRDMFAGLASGVVDIPGMNAESTRYFRDLYDHLIRISDLVDSYRDLLSGVMDTHISTVSNRLNVVMKQLTIIATVFLPLTFLTGFFGQNFPWLVDHLGGAAVFWGVGIGTEVVAVVALFWLARRRGWLGGPSA